MKKKCENCVLFHREHKLDSNGLHYVEYYCELYDESTSPERSDCKFYIENPKEDVDE